MRKLLRLQNRSAIGTCNCLWPCSNRIRCNATNASTCNKSPAYKGALLRGRCPITKPVKHPGFQRGSLEEKAPDRIAAGSLADVPTSTQGSDNGGCTSTQVSNLKWNSGLNNVPLVTSRQPSPVSSLSSSLPVSQRHQGNFSVLSVFGCMDFAPT